MGQHDCQKISITLSNEAYQTITSDMVIFNAENNWAGFINTIIRNYMDESDASISLATARERERLLGIISTTSNITLKQNDVDYLVDVLATNKEKDLIDKYKSYKSGDITKKTWIHKDIYESITEPNEYYNHSHYSGQKGRYVKALLEDYASLDLSERERVFFKPAVKVIEESISDRKQIKIIYKGRNNITSTLRLRPYKLLKYNQYNYLVAIADNTSSPKGYILFTLRLCRMINARKMNSMSGTIRKDIQNSIDVTINEKGIPYLQADNEIIKVRLSPEGQIKYKSKLHLRPRYTQISDDKELSEDGYKIYEFDCTQEQIRNYFFQFGPLAEIRSPDELRAEFAEMYKKASQNYSSKH